MLLLLEAKFGDDPLLTQLYWSNKIVFPVYFAFLLLLLSFLFVCVCDDGFLLKRTRNMSSFKKLRFYEKPWIHL